jgi:hypothetical protein
MRHAQAQCAVSLYSRGALEFACCAVRGQSGKTRHSWSLHRYSFCLCYIRQEEFFAQSGMIQKPATPNSVRSKSCSGGDKQTHLDVVEGFQRAGRTHLVAASPCLGNRQCALENTNLGPAPACPPHIGPPSPHALIRRLRLAMSAAGGPLLLASPHFCMNGPYFVWVAGDRAHPASRYASCEQEKSNSIPRFVMRHLHASMRGKSPWRNAASRRRVALFVMRAKRRAFVIAMGRLLPQRTNSPFCCSLAP